MNEMLDVARMHLEDGAADGVPVDFEVVDAQAIPYADASYDAITMAYGIRNMPDRPLALAEMFRVLPGRHARVLGVLHAAEPHMARAVQLLSEAPHPVFGAGSSRATKRASCTWRAPSRPSPTKKGLAKLMQDAGFTNVTWKNYTGGIAAVHVAVKPEQSAAVHVAVKPNKRRANNAAKREEIPSDLGGISSASTT